MKHFSLCDDIDQEQEVDPSEIQTALTSMLAMGGQEPVDYETREIVINGVIDSSIVERYIMPIITMNKQDDELGIAPENRQPITLYISCLGGDVSQGLALCDIIRASKTPIIGITLPYAYSMGCSIHLACHKRYCLKTSMFLIHDGWIGNETSGSKFKDFLKFLDMQEKQLKNLILSTTKISEELLTQKFNTEWYIDAETALELGMVDAILTEIM